MTPGITDTVPGTVTLWTLTGPAILALADPLTDILSGFPEDVLSVETVYDDEQVAAVRVWTPGSEWTLADTVTACIGPDGWTVSDGVPVAPEDWAEAWKRFWHPTPVTPGLTIVPSWETYTPERPGERILTLDPGMAFGTGAHASTRLVLGAIEAFAVERPVGQCRVLDIGTGSGILALYAALLGCRDVLGQDIDPAVLPIAAANAAQNGLADAIDWTDTPLAELCRTPADLILANILAPVLTDLMPDLSLRLAPGGMLVLSGLVDASVPTLLACAAQYGLRLSRRLDDAPWACLCLVHAA